MFLVGPVRASVVVLCVVLGLVSVSGCRTHRDDKKVTPEALYKKAHKALESYDFNGAIKSYEQLTARFPFTDEARQARLDLIYIRRALRILPAWYALLLILEITGLASFPFIAVSFLFLANFAGLLGISKGYGVLWSLAVEEHFYMLWPFIVHRCSLRKLITLTSLICLGSPFLRILLLVNPVPKHFASLYTWFNLDGLSLGALLAIWLRMPSFRRHQLTRVALPALILGSAAFVMLAGHPWAEVTVAKTACNLASAGFLSCALLTGSSQ
jgi:peptidoglycan/LPS O-acetylase OafA/YrhL